jgi:hypothetical protein
MMIGHRYLGLEALTPFWHSEQLKLLGVRSPVDLGEILCRRSATTFPWS